MFPVYGGIYLVKDDRIALPPEDDRKLHDSRRPFIITSANAQNLDPDWPLAFGFPLSSETTRRTIFDVQFAAGEANLNKKTWARIPAAQPIDKRFLEDYIGTASIDKTMSLMAKLLQYNTN